MFDLFVKHSLVLRGPVALWEGALQLLLNHQVQGDGAEQHGSAPADVPTGPSPARHKISASPETRSLT